MNRDQYLAKRMWLCGAVASAEPATKVLPALLVGHEADQVLKPVLPGPALGGPAAIGLLPGEGIAVELPL